MAAFVSRYASAFADVVTAAKLDTAAIDRQFSDFLSTWDGSPELREIFENPAIPAPQKVEILDKLNAKLKLQKELRNLIAVLISNDRIGQVSEVAQAGAGWCRNSWGFARQRLLPRAASTAKERDALLAEIAMLAGSRIEASFKLDKSILGGTVVRIGTTVYDGSVRGRLERLKEAPF